MGYHNEESVSQPALWACLSKRTFDLAIALALLLLFAPLLALIALLVKLDSPGPVFFRQVRVGRGRRPFRMWKFRKMRHDLPAQGPCVTRRYDNRLTRVGGLLERTKLDELPQLFNVLAGDMSIVGPRPEVPQFVEHYPEQWEQVLAVKPGLVGPCQVRFRNESELYPEGCPDVEGYYVRQILPAKLVVDAEYASRHSLVRDAVLFVQAGLVSMGGIVTRQTLSNRRWQIVNTLVLSLAGFAATLVVTRLLRYALAPESAGWVLLFAALAKPACVIAFKIPKGLATSVAADDMLRCCWCAAVAGALIGCGLLFADFRGVGRSFLLADTVLFLAVLVLYKLTCYNVYAGFFRQKSGAPWLGLGLASLVVGPWSMAVVLTARHGPAAWASPDFLPLSALVLLALLVRPAVFLFKPMASGSRRLSQVFGQLALGTLVGSSLIVSGALLVNERGISRLDIALDATLYLSLMTVIAHRLLGARAARTVGAGHRERLLLVGEGSDLGGYVGALSGLPAHRFEVVGALTTRRGYRTSMAGGVPVLGEVEDAPELVRTLGATRVVVLDTDIDDTALEGLRAACGLQPEQVVRVEVLAPLMRLWRLDGVGTNLPPSLRGAVPVS
jgi:lipopolysaccharide/colanic/teichoic acid biosynthesis glycosyltransferase